MLDAFGKAISRNHLLEKYEKKIAGLEKRIDTLTDQVEKLKRFVASKGLGDAFVEFVKSLSPKTMKQKIEDAKEDAVIDAIINDSDMEIPEPMLETQQKQLVDDFAQRIQMQGINIEQYYQLTGSNYDMMLEQVKPQADKRIKSRLVLEAVVEKEGIEVSEEEYTKETERMAEIYQMEAEKVREMLEGREKEQVMKDLAIRKAIDFVVENAKEK